MSYRPIEIANYFLSRHEGITSMKINKLVYIAHGWYLGISGQQLIDENPEAWKYGPVIPSLYHEFKRYGRDSITRLSRKTNIDNPVVERFLDKIWEVYGEHDAVTLSAMTHKSNTPWHNTWNSVKNGVYYSLQIPETHIRDYYKLQVVNNKRSMRENQASNE